MNTEVPGSIHCSCFIYFLSVVPRIGVIGMSADATSIGHTTAYLLCHSGKEIGMRLGFRIYSILYILHERGH